MVSADQVAGAARGFGEDAGATVAADVVQDVDSTIIVAQHDQGVWSVVEGDVVSGFRNFCDAGGEEPVGAEDGFHFDLEDGWVGVERGVQGVALASIGEEFGNLVELISL